MSDSNTLPPPVYFSVDVETTGLTPRTGKLLSVGVLAIRHHGDYLIPDRQFYGRIDRTDDLIEMGWWSDEDRVCLPGLEECISPTHAWWSGQPQEAQWEAFGFAGDYRLRERPGKVASDLIDFVTSFDVPWEQRIFVADPVAFDSMWVTSLFDEAGVETPFHYHSRDITSIEDGAGYKPSRYTEFEGRPLVPHHALDDAIAQGLQFIELTNWTRYRDEALQQVVSLLNGTTAL